MAAPAASVEKKDALQSLRYTRGNFEVLDQLVVPHGLEFLPVKDANDGWSVIRKMQVRGAPLIAMVACLSLAVEATAMDAAGKVAGMSADEAKDFLLERMQHLRTSRPTAVNLFVATDKFAEVVKEAAAEKGATGASVVTTFVEGAEAMLENDLNANKTMGAYGKEAMLAKAPGGATKLKVVTICNTGSLATAGWGTALGVVRSLHETDNLDHIYSCETRPYNQGARLTAFEIVCDELPGTLICDSMASALMNVTEGGIHACVVGADRVVVNGDTANKIGTYQLAIAAKHHGVPFFVALDTTGIDVNTPTGAGIPIEERAAQELRAIAGVQVAPEAINVWNPAFDVTPGSLIAGIITELGVAYPDPATGEYDMAKFLADARQANGASEPPAKKQKK